MLSRSSAGGGSRLVSAAAAVIFFLVWSFSYWHVPLDATSLRRPWSSSEPKPELQKPEHSGLASFDAGSRATAGMVEDAFFKQYQKSHTADTTGSLSTAFSANG